MVLVTKYIVMDTNLEYNDEYYYEAGEILTDNKIYNTLEEAQKAAKEGTIATIKSFRIGDFEDYNSYDSGFRPWLEEFFEKTGLQQSDIEYKWTYSELIKYCEDHELDYWKYIPRLNNVYALEE